MAISARLTANIDVSQTEYVGANDNIQTIRAGKSNGYRQTVDEDSDPPVTVCFTDRRELNPSGNVSYDLSGSVIQDLFGNDAVFGGVIAIQVVNHSSAPLAIDGVSEDDTTASVTLTGNFITGNFGASTSIPLAAGCKFHWGPGWLDVINSTRDTLTITNTSGAQSAYIDVLIVGYDGS